MTVAGRPPVHRLSAAMATSHRLSTGYQLSWRPATACPSAISRHGDQPPTAAAGPPQQYTRTRQQSMSRDRFVTESGSVTHPASHLHPCHTRYRLVTESGSVTHPATHPCRDRLVTESGSVTHHASHPGRDRLVTESGSVTPPPVSHPGSV